MVNSTSYTPKMSNTIYNKIRFTHPLYTNKPVNFTGNNFMIIKEKSSRKIEFLFRRLFNTISDKLHPKNFDEITKEFKNVDVNSEEFIDKLLKIINKYTKKMEVEINLEDENIEKIVNSKRPHIFIMNHDKQLRDPNMLAVFGKILYTMYKNAGQSATCPRTKIILNEDILLSMRPEQANILKKIGAIGIDASIHSTDIRKNAKAMFPMLRDFIKGKAHIFIFPEGRLARRKPTLKERFQSGVSEMIAKLMDKTDEVNVTPLAFAYNKFSRKNLTSIFVGKPITFKRENDFVTTTKGNIDSDFASKRYKKYFADINENESKTITDQGIPVEQTEVSDYISGILCENLEICKNEAKKNLPKTSLGDKASLL